MDKEIFLNEFGHLAQGPDGVKKLRDLILQLAVQGKLVEQDPNDEPIAKVLKKNGILYSETSSALENLPRGWSSVCLQNLGRFFSGMTPSKSKAEYWNGTVPWVSSRDMKKKTILSTHYFITERALNETTLKIVPKGALLMVVRSGILRHTFPVAIAGVDCTINQDQKALNLHLPEMAPFIQTLLSGWQSLILSQLVKTGMTVQSVMFDDFKKYLWPIPPLAEQKRIVAKVDELMALCDELEASQETNVTLKRDCVASTLHHLSEARDKDDIKSNWSIAENNFGKWFDDLETVKNLRATILQLAVQGKLVEQDPNDEPMDNALNKIAEKREELIASGIINRLKNIPKIDNAEIPFKSPDNWRWGRYNELLRFIDYRGKTPPKVEAGIPLITAKNVKNGFINREPREFITEEFYSSWMTRGFPEIGDILITVEAPLGNVALVDIEEDFALAQRVICLQPWLKTEVSSRFLMLVILSPFGQDQLNEKSSGMTATGIKAQRLKLLPLPLPPLAEQKRIVAKVDELMALCDKLETQILLSQNLNKNLMASLCHHMTVN